MINKYTIQSLRHRLQDSSGLDRSEAKELLVPICQALLAIGVTKLTACYQVYADEGAVEDPEFFPEKIEVPEDLQELVEDWIHATLPIGWEIEDGSQGEVMIDVPTCRAQFDHEIKTIESAPFEIE